MIITDKAIRLLKTLKNTADCDKIKKVKSFL